MAKSENKFSFNNFLNFLNEHFSLIIIILIILVVGFLGGSLWTENQMLKSDKTVEVKEQAVNLEKTDETLDESLVLENVPDINDTDHFLGTKNADVIMISYSDFQCPYCQRWHPTFSSLVEKYGNKITFVYRHFSLGFSYSDKLAQASECVAEYGGEEAFWKFTDSLYEKLVDESIYTVENGNSIITDDSVLTIAANSGVSANHVQTCLANQDKAGCYCRNDGWSK
jgi:thiol-disulfide isomerase/thioredoxin